MSDDIQTVREALEDDFRAWVCSQCGNPFGAPACGPTHAVIAADPRQHRDYAASPLAALDRIEAVVKAAREYVEADCEWCQSGSCLHLEDEQGGLIRALSALDSQEEGS